MFFFVSNYCFAKENFASEVQVYITAVKKLGLLKLIKQNKGP